MYVLFMLVAGCIYIYMLAMCLFLYINIAFFSGKIRAFEDYHTAPVSPCDEVDAKPFR